MRPLTQAEFESLPEDRQIEELVASVESRRQEGPIEWRDCAPPVVREESPEVHRAQLELFRSPC